VVLPHDFQFVRSRFEDCEHGFYYQFALGNTKMAEESRGLQQELGYLYTGERGQRTAESIWLIITETGSQGP
jgi:hypothetical protein